MNSEQNGSLLGLLGLAVVGIVIFSLMYYAKLWAARPETYSADPGRDKIVLALDESHRIGSEKIIYRGLAEDGRITMAVILMQMDPEYPYIHRIEIEEAKEGFTLVGHRFELISASGSRLQFYHIKDPPALSMTGDGSLPPLDPVRLGPKIAWGP